MDDLPLNNARRLFAIKLVHTLIWIFFNVVIFYLLYSVIINRIGKLFWLGTGLILFEGIILVVFRLSCPLTLIARRFSSSGRPNFDIFLPEWLARYNKQIYTSIFILVTLILMYRFVA